MIRAAPCEVYLKFLVSHPDNKSTDQIRGIVRAQHLDFPNDAYVNDLRDGMRLPTPFKPHDKLHIQSSNFLMRHQLVGFYHPDEACNMAHRFMLRSPRAKEIIETMALAGETPSVISHRLRTLNIRSTTDGVKRYLTFYWDLTKVDSVEVNALLRMRYEHMSYRGELSPDERLQRDVMKKAQYADSRLAVAKMSSTPMAGILHQMRQGYMPTKADLSKLASATRTAAVARAFESMVGDHPNAADMGQGFALIAKLMGDVIESVGDPDAALSQQLQQLAVKTATERIPTIHQLSGGHHTTDMGPVVVEGKLVKETS